MVHSRNCHGLKFRTMNIVISAFFSSSCNSSKYSYILSFTLCKTLDISPSKGPGMTLLSTVGLGLRV